MCNCLDTIGISQERECGSAFHVAQSCHSLSSNDTHSVSWESHLNILQLFMRGVWFFPSLITLSICQPTRQEEGAGCGWREAVVSLGWELVVGTQPRGGSGGMPLKMTRVCVWMPWETIWQVDFVLNDTRTWSFLHVQHRWPLICQRHLKCSLTQAASTHMSRP